MPRELEQHAVGYNVCAMNSVVSMELMGRLRYAPRPPQTMWVRSTPIHNIPPADSDGAIRYRIPEEQILTREALDASREAFARHHRMETHESPTNDRLDVAARWTMRLYEQDGKAFAVCYKNSGWRYTAYSIDPAKSRSTGIVCYSTGSAEPMNGKPREEFETWALEELEKPLRAEERPPF